MKNFEWAYITYPDLSHVDKAIDVELREELSQFSGPLESYQTIAVVDRSHGFLFAEWNEFTQTIPAFYTYLTPLGPCRSDVRVPEEARQELVKYIINFKMHKDKP